MKTLFVLLIALMDFAMISLLVHAQAGPPSAISCSPMSQPLIREGTLTVQLASELRLGITENEAGAEGILSTAGLEPRTGCCQGVTLLYENH